MGLTSWTGEVPRKADVAVAQNYLGADELEALNRIVTAYLLQRRVGTDLLCAQYHMIAYLTNALGVALEPTAPRFPAAST